MNGPGCWERFGYRLMWFENRSKEDDIRGSNVAKLILEEFNKFLKSGLKMRKRFCKTTFIQVLAAWPGAIPLSR